MPKTWEMTQSRPKTTAWYFLPNAHFTALHYQKSCSINLVKIAIFKEILASGSSEMAKHTRLNTKVQFPNSNVARKRYDKWYDNRTSRCNGHLSLAGAAGLRKYVYGNGFTVMERISGTLLKASNANLKSRFYIEIFEKKPPW